MAPKAVLDTNETGDWTNGIQSKQHIISTFSTTVETLWPSRKFTARQRLPAISPYNSTQASVTPKRRDSSAKGAWRPSRYWCHSRRDSLRGMDGDHSAVMLTARPGCGLGMVSVHVRLPTLNVLTKAADLAFMLGSAREAWTGGTEHLRTARQGAVRECGVSGVDT